MASNALFKRDVKAREMGVRLFFGTVTYGASGAISSHTCFGFTPTDGGTGITILTFNSKFPKLLSVSAICQVAAGDVGRVLVTADTLATDGKISLTHIGATGAADNASTSKMLIMVAVKNTTVK